jgi:tripartite-type tricarboxylate transporter receptor subunit TctC
MFNFFKCLAHSPSWIAGAVALLLTSFGCGGSAPVSQEWPGQRPIRVVCFTNPGGDTDVVSRILAGAMEPILGTRISVVNKPGAHGGLAMREVWSQNHDGYRWGGFSSNILTAAVMGGHDTTAKEWDYLIVGGSPGVLSVRENSPYQNLDDLIAAAKTKPRGINAGASVTGGVWHVQLGAVEAAAGVSFNFVPYEGSHPTQLALLSEEIDVILTSLAEQAELIKAGRVRPLAAMTAEPATLDEISIPAIGATFPAAGEPPVEQWLGFGVPRDLPGPVMEKIVGAFEQAMASPAINEMIESRYMTKFAWTPAEARERVLKTEKAWAWTLVDMEIAEVSPDEVGIAKP